MIRRKTARCPKGHSYSVIRPSKYDGVAQYPPECGECRMKRT